MSAKQNLITQLGFTGVYARDVSTMLGIELHIFDYKGCNLETLEAVLGKPFMVGPRVLYKVGEEGTISVAKRNKTVTFAAGLSIYHRAMELPANHPNFKFVVRN